MNKYLQVLVAASSLLLAGCETAPRSGAQIHALVTQVARERSQLDGTYRDLHAAVRSGVTRADIAAGRLVRGECVEMGEGTGGRTRSRVLTMLLPPGQVLQLQTLADAEEVRADGAGLHLRFLAGGDALGPSEMRPSAFAGGRAYPLCRQPGGTAARWRLLVTGVYQGWEFDFAAAELARQDQFSDAEMADGRVVQVSCQLKVLDGSDWYAPVWWARVPPGLSLQSGDAVLLQAGAENGSKDTGPLAQVLARTSQPAGVPAPGRVLCYQR
ncbi:MAG: hypothetical protein ACOY95_08700 [Pseudomonadota bacterium]